MIFDLTVQTDAGTQEVRTKPVDLIRLERHFGMSIAEVFVGGQPKLDHIYYLAWSALRRTGQDVGEYEDWLETVEEVEFDADEESEPAPLDRTPTTDSQPT